MDIHIFSNLVGQIKGQTFYFVLRNGLLKRGNPKEIQKNSHGFTRVLVSLKFTGLVGLKHRETLEKLQTIWAICLLEGMVNHLKSTERLPTSDDIDSYYIYYHLYLLL